jgi:hypothetical protein
VQHVVEERTVVLLFHQRQHGAEGGGDVTVYGEVERCPLAETVRS